jgi:sugar phosphate isomerase/epimerase
MHRRAFNKNLFILAAGSMSLSAFAEKKSKDRLAMSTVNFRERFLQTMSAQSKEAQRYRPLVLTDVPSYFRDRFGLKQVEFWSKHFESVEAPYLKELKKSLKKSKSQLINIQFDEDYQIGSPDKVLREKSIALALKWVEASKILGSGAIRVNPGTGEAAHAIQSLKIINEACKKRGLILMVENHFGMEMDPALHVRIVKEVGQNAYTLPDFGNYNDATRYNNLYKIIPYAYQISAKTMAFDKDLNHTSYDFDNCMLIARELAFKGIYSVEQWSREFVKESDEAIADWMISRIKGHLLA